MFGVLWFLCNVNGCFQLWKTKRNYIKMFNCAFFLFTFNKNWEGKKIGHGWTMCVCECVCIKTEGIVKHHGMAWHVLWPFFFFVAVVFVCYHRLLNMLKRKLIIIHYVQINMVFVTFYERSKCVVTKYILTIMWHCCSPGNSFGSGNDELKIIAVYQYQLFASKWLLIHCFACDFV